MELARWPGGLQLRGEEEGDGGRGEVKGEGRYTVRMFWTSGIKHCN